MAHEWEPNKEAIRPGQLYFLVQPGAELFSGYGLTTQENRIDRLAGLLMVDRPHPVDPAWLGEIERLYGDYQLVPMTQSGERGIVTLMRIEKESLGFLQRNSMSPLSGQLTQALRPLLKQSPAPVLKVRWDEETKLWRSEFWIGLPPVLQAVFARTGEGAIPVERDDGTVAFVTHAADSDIESFRNAQVFWRWEFIEMPSAPLIRFRSVILDDPDAPYVLEHFLNVDDVAQARCLARLVNQEELTFDFYGQEYEYVYSKRIAHPPRMRVVLERMVRRTIEVYGDIPEAERDFDQAKAAYQRHNPL